MKRVFEYFTPRDRGQRDGGGLNYQCFVVCFVFTPAGHLKVVVNAARAERTRVFSNPGNVNEPREIHPVEAIWVCHPDLGAAVSRSPSLRAPARVRGPAHEANLAHANPI